MSFLSTDLTLFFKQSFVTLMHAHHKSVDNAENILNEFLKYLLIS